MTRRLIALLAALAAGAAATAALSASAQTLRVMSFNVRLSRVDDGANSWANRRDLMVATIRAEAPDIIGTQELMQDQGDYIRAALPGWNWFGIDRRGGHADEHMGIFYNRARLRLIDSGQFWLSDTPDVAGSISWGNLYPRMASWGVFETVAGKRRFTLVNTHFPYRAEDEAARERAARLIAARLGDWPGPLVLTGDFNTDTNSRAHAILSESLRDSWAAVRTPAGPRETFHGFTGKTDGRRIDWIMARGLNARRTRTVASARDGRYPSDHFPVVTDFSFGR